MSFKRHNKKRNSALLYEFLVRHISKCLMNKNKEGANQALNISKRYFSKGSLLNQELSLFNTVLGTKVRSRHSAQKIISDVCDRASNMNARKLDVEKSRLIKEINHTLKDGSFYDHKIPNYTVYASVHTLLNETRNKKKTLDSIDRIKLEDTVVEHLVGKEDKVADVLKVNPEYNSAVYKFVIERFHKKYDQSLNEEQKKILTKYAVSMISGNTGVLKSALQKESKNIQEKLSRVKDEKILEDKELMRKLQECKSKFINLDFENITEEKILEVLQFMKLVEEVES